MRYSLPLVATLLYAVVLVNATQSHTGFCYEPFHDSRYPSNVEAVLHDDFSIIRKYSTSIRTFYSSYVGVSVAPIAKQHGLSVYLGVYLTSEFWQQEQIDAAIEAAKTYPDTVLAIIVGNEDLGIDEVGEGFYSAGHIKGIIVQIQNALRNAGVYTPVGTVQRINEWLIQDPQIDDLANTVDIIGVNIYPFFSNGWNINEPTKSLDAQWIQVVQRFPDKSEKLRLTETGWPTEGDVDYNAPSYNNAQVYFNSILNWVPPLTSIQVRFVFSFFDRAQNDPILQYAKNYEAHFGVMSASGGIMKYNVPLLDNQDNQVMGAAQSNYSTTPLDIGSKPLLRGTSSPTTTAPKPPTICH